MTFLTLFYFFSVTWAVLPVLPSNQWNSELALGWFYQIGDIPQFYETTYKYCTSANYQLLANNSILVTNIARDAPSPQASSCVVYGTATFGTPTSIWNLLLWNNKCSQDIPYSSGQTAGTLAWNFVWPPTSTKQFYQAAIATGYPRNNIYVLSRTPTLSANAMTAIQSYLVRFGGPPSQWTFTVQQGCW